MRNGFSEGGLKMLKHALPLQGIIIN
jgi:hypothetical protein